jgi:hypothetical protein
VAQTLAVRSVESGKQAKLMAPATRFSFVEPKDSARYVLSIASEKEYTTTATTYSDKVKRDTNTHRITNNQLRLPLTNGKEYIVKNNLADNDSYLEYKYIGQLHAIDKYVLACTGYEWSEYFIVDKNTGDTTVFFNQPRISPKNTRMACVYYDTYQTESQAIQISTYRLLNKQIAGSHSTYIRIGDEHYPLECTLVWENEQSFLVEIQFEKASPQYLRIRMRK